MVIIIKELIKWLGVYLSSMLMPFWSPSLVHYQGSPREYPDICKSSLLCPHPGAQKGVFPDLSAYTLYLNKDVKLEKTVMPLFPLIMPLFPMILPLFPMIPLLSSVVIPLSTVMLLVPLLSQ